jgi:CBS domain-containing protein
MDLVASQVMRRSITTVPKLLPLPLLERAFLSSGISGFPVVDEDELVGVVSRSDVIRQLSTEQEVAAKTSDFYHDSNGFHELPVLNGSQVSERIGQRMQELKVADVMHSQLHEVDADQTIRAVAQKMVDNNIHRVLVTREGRLLGLISSMDIVRLYAQGRLKPA